MARFILRETGVILILAGIAAWIGHAQLGWGGAAVPIAAYAAVIAWLMGAISYYASRRALFDGVHAQLARDAGETESQGSDANDRRPARAAVASQTMKWTWGGMVLGIAVLGAGWGLIRQVHGAEYSERVLVLVAVFYLLVLFLKVLTLSQELKEAQAMRWAGGERRQE